MLSVNTEFQTLIGDFSTPRMCKPPSDIMVLKGNREEIKYQISELAARCWWMWLEGMLPDVFKESKDNTACAVCYYFTIEQELDEGEISQRNFFEEKLEDRKPDSLLMEELYNFMLSVTYDQKLAYGGGTKQYIGDAYSFKGIRVNNPREIRLSSNIETIPVTYLQDFTGIIKEDTRLAISKLGDKLFEQNSLLLVVVADEIHRNDRTDLRRLIERLNMNSDKNTYDAVVITLDATSGNIRIHAGIEFQEYIHELQIKSLLERNFKFVETPEELNSALKQLIDEIYTELDEKTGDTATREWTQNSFYAYLTNDGVEELYLSDISVGRTYAISYSASSTITNFFKGLLSESDRYTNWLSHWRDQFTGRLRVNNNAKNAIIIQRAQEVNSMCRITQ